MPVDSGTELAKVINSTTYNLGYAYNDAGQLTSITYPSNRVVSQTFDEIGRLEKVTSSSVDYLTVTDFTAAHAVHTATLGNGVEATFGFNDRLQMSSLQYTKNSTDLLKLAYHYKTDSTNCPNGALGNNGQIQCIVDSSSTTGASGRSVSYSYDAWARLKTAVTSGSTQFPQWGLSWTYDRYGNRTNQTVTHGSGPSSSLGISTSTNRITDSGYTYDSSGNLTNDGLNALVYDGENHVTSSTQSGATANYTYDGAGLRIKKVSGSTTTIYIFSGTKVIAEYENGASVTSPTREYLYGGSQLLASIEGSTTRYHLNDHLSTRVLADTSGTAVAESGHFPFGENWYSSGSPGSLAKLKFTSYERDSESSNDFAMARYHVNRLGRFNSPDPIAGSVADPQSMNRYAYTRNDPINLTDPLGLFIVPFMPSVDGNGGGTPGGFSGWAWIFERYFSYGCWFEDFPYMRLRCPPPGMPPRSQSDEPPDIRYTGPRVDLTKLLGPSPQPPPPRPECDPAVIAAFGEIWRRTGRLPTMANEAAFRYGADGSIDYFVGPRVDVTRGEIPRVRFEIVLDGPNKTLFVAHSHPLGPRPSQPDRNLSYDNNIRNYVVSLFDVWVTNPQDRTERGDRRVGSRNYPCQ